MLDGTMTSQKLFVLTVNDTWSVSSHMKNRPGRLFYNIEFSGLGAQFIREYCEDKLEDKEQVEPVLQASALFDQFNFDMLKALVEEMNRYKETPFQALEMLNAKPVMFSGYSETYEVIGWNPDGVKGTAKDSKTHPLAHRGEAMGFYFDIDTETIPDDRAVRTRLAETIGLEVEDLVDHLTHSGVHVAVKKNDVRRIDAENGRYEYVTDEGYRVQFIRKEVEHRRTQDYSWYGTTEEE
jgi:hypothetical protein